MKNVNDTNLEKLVQNRSYHPSPAAWENEVLYFLLLDRFADGQEDKRRLFNPETDNDSVLKDEQALAAWHERASDWNGGNLRGLAGRLDYLQNLGITAIWISPVFKQASYAATYHGYGIQDFLDIDPHFGSREDLCYLVQEAHKRGIYVILDVILNHAGDVFEYETDHTPYRQDKTYPVRGFRDRDGKPSIAADSPDFSTAGADDGVWPQELFSLDSFSRKGHIVDWDAVPEHLEGDFFSLKNINTGQGDYRSYEPSSALRILTECYKYWLAYADIDGYRLDTVKHLEQGATRFFAREIHEFAHMLGKHNFYIIGEITGGTRFAMETLKRTGLNAALGINEAHEKLEQVAKGLADPALYFNLFSNSPLDEEEERWYRNNVIVMFDDHDMVAQPCYKQRFAAEENTAPLLRNALFLNIFSVGIPCIYYGSEQAFDGQGEEDKFIREAMFGSDYGAFRSRGRHFFNPDHEVYRAVAEFTGLRRKYSVLRYGRQYLRQQLAEDNQLVWPTANGEGRYDGVTAWSRILSSCECVLAINNSLEHDRSVKILVDAGLNPEKTAFRCLLSARSSQKGETADVKRINGINHIQVEVPRCGYVLYIPVHGGMTMKKEKL